MTPPPIFNVPKGIRPPMMRKIGGGVKELDFFKMVAAGNDFIVADNRLGIVAHPVFLAKKLCDRKFSIGADGLLLLENSKKADVRMRIFNPDGSQAEMCGNGVRCLAKFAFEKKIAKNSHSIETLAGTIFAFVRGDDVVKAKMVEPKGLRLNVPVSAKGARHLLNLIDTGVPHAVKVLASVDEADVEGLGRVLRRHPFFSPRGSNVNFMSFGPGAWVHIRTYERGVEGETLACGTGSTAGALVAAALKNFKSPVKVKTRSGETLKVYFLKKEGRFEEVYLEGRVTTSFRGRVKI